MKATAIYIPELGRVFFIEEILSISNIEETFDYDCFIIEFKFDKKIQINTTDYRTRKDLESIRNQSLQHCNIINAQETTKEQPKDKIIVTVLGGVAYCDDPRVQINDLDNR